MPTLAAHPSVVAHARALGLSPRGDALRAIRIYAVEQVDAIISDAGDVRTLGDLFERVKDRYSVRVEFLRDASDLPRIAARYASFHPHLRARLEQEFLRDGTEGLTLERDQWDPRFHRYLAVIDARGERASRAYFTAWHELTHLVVHPSQLQFPGFRRTTVEIVQKDPLESMVDHVAGELGFHRPIFQPLLLTAVGEHGVSFRAVEAARDGLDPLPSLFATAIAAVNQVDSPAVFVDVQLALKKAAVREQHSGQQFLSFASPPPAVPRATKVVPNAAAKHAGFAIHKNMRVPPTSVLQAVLEHPTDIDLVATEDQAAWESTGRGHLAPLSMTVHAARRGRYVYGLLVVGEGQ